MGSFEKSIDDVYEKGFFEEVTAGCDMYKRVKCFNKSYAYLAKHSSPTAGSEHNDPLGEHISDVHPTEPIYNRVRPDMPPELYHKRVMSYHTEPPKRNYDISEIQLRTPFNRRDFNDLNEDFVKTITEDYNVRSMSEYARQYGFYSVFIVGEQHTYFVYGIDNEFLNKTKFVEHDGKLYTYEFVRENGYCRGEDWINFYWNVINVDEFKDPMYGGKYVMHQFAAVEFLRFVYTDVGMPLPLFVVLGIGDAIRYIKSRHFMARSKKFEGSAKQHYLNVLCQYLQDIAIWNWPVRSPKDCGYLAFILGTRYNAISYIHNRSEKEVVYNDPNRWTAALYDAEHVSVKSFRDRKFWHDEAEFIYDKMQEMGVFCHYVETRSAIEDAETDVIYDSLYTDNEKEIFDSRDKVKWLRYCTFDSGLVEYLDEEYTEYVLSDECMDYGDMLLREMTEEETEECTSHTGLIVDLIPTYTLESSLYRAAAAHINMGHPRDWRFRFPYSKGIYFVTPYYNIATSFSRYPFENEAFHFLNTSDMPYNEARGFSPAYDGRMWRRNIFMDDKVQGYSMRSYPNDLAENGLIVSNDGMDIPVADDETFSQSY